MTQIVTTIRGRETVIQTLGGEVAEIVAARDEALALIWAAAAEILATADAAMGAYGFYVEFDGWDDEILLPFEPGEVGRIASLFIDGIGQTMDSEHRPFELDGNLITLAQEFPEGTKAYGVVTIFRNNELPTVQSEDVAMTGGGSLDEWRDRETRAEVIAFIAGKTPPAGRTIGWKGGFRIRYEGALYVAGLPDAPQWVPDGDIWGEHFGVAYDGTTDSRSALREAITWAGGKVLNLSEGTIRIVPVASGTTAVQSPAALTTIRGHNTALMLDAPDTSFYALVDHSNHVTWEGITFTDDAPDGGEIALVNASSGGRFDRCKFVSNVVNNGGAPSKSVYSLNFSATVGFSDLDILHCEFRNVNFGPLKTNAATSNHARINCVGIKSFDVWYCPLMFNSPNGDLTDITMRDIYAENFESVDSERHVLGVATGNAVIVDGVIARGSWWEVLHFEENVRNLIVSNITAEITEGDVIGLLAYTDPVLRRPEQVTITNVTAEKLGSRGNTCIKLTYDALPARSADWVVINTFTAKNFEYGLMLGIGALGNVRVSDGILIDCQYGIRYSGNFHGDARGLTFIGCDVAIKSDNGGAIHDVVFDGCAATHEVTSGALLVHGAKWNFGALDFTAGETKWFRLFRRLAGSKGSLAIKAFFGAARNHHVVATIDWDGSTEGVATQASVSTGGEITATPALINEASAVAIAAGGTGYTIGDVLTVSGGTLETNGTSTTATVTSESGGVVTGVSLTNPGEWAVVPSNAVSTTGGTGTGCTLNLTTVKTMACRVYDSGNRTGTRITAELQGWALVQ